MQTTLKEKVDELKKEKFSEQACYNFFGSLTENEIKFFLEQFQKPETLQLSAEQKKIIITYLEKMLQKIEEIKKQNNQ